MSLFDKITQGFSQVSDLFSKQEANANDALSESNKTTSTSFWSNLFGKNSTPSFNQNAGLRLTAQNIKLSNDDIKGNLAREAARVNPPVKAQEYKEGVQTDGSYIANVLPRDVGAVRWSKEVDPADISRAALRKAALGTGIASSDAEAKQIVDNLHVNGLKTHTNKGERFVDKSDVGFGAWVNQHTIRQGIWQVKAGTDDIANLRESARQLKLVILTLPLPRLTKLCNKQTPEFYQPVLWRYQS